MVSLSVTHVDGAARAGILHTPRGPLETPAFMPVGTAGSIKGVTPGQLRQSGARLILANTYHLHLRPGDEVVRDLGGLHRFMGWDGPILTDSGGYQVFSLGTGCRVTDEGVFFRSHVDGAAVTLTPQSAVQIQVNLGADIIMVLDQCPPLPAEPAVIRTAVDRTLRWAGTCRETLRPNHQAMFGIVQGGLDLDLRGQCVNRLIDMGFDGYAVGGLSVGETHEEMVRVLRPVVSALPADRPRYLMGVGMPRDLLAAVQTGIDLFDCVLPTRNGRNSWAFTPQGMIRLRNTRYKSDGAPLETDCPCETCRAFSRGYLRHLFLAGEMLGPTLTSIHNLVFFQRFMARVRELIRSGGLATITAEYPIAASAAVPDPNDEEPK